MASVTFTTLYFEKAIKQLLKQKFMLKSISTIPLKSYTHTCSFEGAVPLFTLDRSVKS